MPGYNQIETLDDLLRRRDQEKQAPNMSMERAPAMEVKSTPDGRKHDFQDEIGGDYDGQAPMAKPIMRTEYDNAMTPTKGPTFAPQEKLDPKRVVGEIAPDFSGYDSLEARLAKLQKEPHWAEILGGSIGAIGGMMYGQAGAGMKASGDALTGVAAKYDKKNDDIQKMLLEIEAKRAATLAKGKKGTKMTGDRENAYARQWGDKYGNIHWMTEQDADGNWAPTENDRIIRFAPSSVVDKKNRNGDVDQLYKQGTMGAKVGEEAVKLDSETDGRGNRILENRRTGYSFMPQGSKSVTGKSPKAATAHEALRNKYLTDTTRKKLEEGHGQVIRGFDGMGLGTKGGYKTAVKMAIQNLEPGGRMSEGDFKYIADSKLGIMKDLEHYIDKMADGEELHPDMAKEINDILMLADQAYRRDFAKLNKGYEKDTRYDLNDEFNDKDLDYLRELSKYDAKTQQKGVNNIIKKGNSLSTAPVEKVKIPTSNGEMTHGFVRKNPITGKIEFVRTTDG